MPYYAGMALKSFVIKSFVTQRRLLDLRVDIFSTTETQSHLLLIFVHV